MFYLDGYIPLICYGLICVCRYFDIVFLVLVSGPLLITTVLLLITTWSDFSIIHIWMDLPTKYINMKFILETASPTQ